MSWGRPSVKIRFWSPRFTNRPDVEPPGLLKLVSALSIASIVVFLLYAVAQRVTGSTSADATEVALVSILHFVLPLAAFYTITTNSPLSRPVLTVYFLAMSAAVFTGRGALELLNLDDTVAAAISSALVLAGLAWLYGSPKMRYYYLSLSGRPIPSDLAWREDELRPKAWLSPKARTALSSLLDYAEIIVLVGFIVIVVYAFLSTT